MKILFHTVFYPSIGGMEAIAEMLADEWVKAGVQVTVVTRVHANHENDERHFPYPVIRNPRPMTFLRLVWDCDVFFQNGLSLRGIWPLLILRRPFVVRHGIWYHRVGNKKRRRTFLKRLACRFAVNISASEAVARSHGAPGVVIGNPYNDRVFHIHEGVERNKELVFVGRLVSDKGVDVLLEALCLLRNRCIRPFLSVIGEGPERAKLERQAIESGLSDRIRFVGRIKPEEVAPLLCEHKILVVPSRWNEPYGIVALESIACGCAVIGSSGGGLPEAMGPCGVMFSNGNSEELAKQIETLLTDDKLRVRLLENAPAHLEDRRIRNVAARYLEVFQQAVEKKLINRDHETTGVRHEG